MDPVTIFMAVMVGVMLFGAGTDFGKRMKEYPSDEEMIRRLVSTRVEQKVKKWTASELEREIEERADAAAHRAMCPHS